MPNEPPAPDADPAGLALRAEEARHIRAAVAGLPDDRRQVVLLRFASLGLGLFIPPFGVGFFIACALGRTPVEVRFSGDRPTISLKLSKPGFDDLSYTISAADAPDVKLRLTPARRHRGTSRAPRFMLTAGSWRPG